MPIDYSAPEKNTVQRINSAAGAIGAVYDNSGPDVADADTRLHFALAAIAESNVAIATAIHELAENVAELRPEE